MHKPEITLIYENGSFQFNVPWALRGHALAVPGVRYDRSHKCWATSATPMACYELAQAFEIDAKNHHLFEQLQQHGERMVRGEMTALPPMPPEVEGHLPVFGTEIWKHQIDALRWLYKIWGLDEMLDTGGALLWFGMGTGKTLIALAAALMTGVSRILVGCPLSVVPAWKKQVELHYPGEFEVVLLQGTVKKKAQMLREATMNDHSRLLIVCNYESIWRVPMGDTVKNAGFQMVIADECHRLKGRNTRQSNFFREMASYVPYRLGLSGTPLSNGKLSDAFGQYAFFDPGVFGTSITRFENVYAYKGDQNFVLSWKNVPQFYERFWFIARHEDRSVLDLPPSIDVDRTFKLEGEAQRVYEDVEETFIADLQDGKILWATNAAVRVSKLQQVTSGTVLVDDEPQHIHDQRLKLLHEILEDTFEEPVIVFCKYRADIRMAREAARRAGRTDHELSGEAKELEEWQEAEGNEVLVVQIDSGSEGIDLSRAAVCVFFSIGYSLSTYDQARARLHRPGQERNVTFTHLIAQGTVDEAIRRSIELKQDLVQGVLDHYQGEEA